MPPDANSPETPRGFPSPRDLTLDGYPFESIAMQTCHESRGQAVQRLSQTIERIRKAAGEQCLNLRY